MNIYEAIQNSSEGDLLIVWDSFERRLGFMREPRKVHTLFKICQWYDADHGDIWVFDNQWEIIKKSDLNWAVLTHKYAVK